jgi:hypothetical protein
MTGNEVRFEFFWQHLDSSSVRQPVRVYKLLLYSPAEKRVVWRIIAADEAKTTNTIVYGIVPPGFYQTIPEKGKPPSLRKGETYRVDVFGERAGVGFVSFIYKGD